MQPHSLTSAVAQARSILLTGPLDLDGDAVGAIVALGIAIARRWPEKQVRVVTDEALPGRYRFLEVPEARFEQAAAVAVAPVDLAVVLDGDCARLGAASAHFQAARVRAQIDHHKSSDPRKVDVAFLDAGAASTTQLVLELCDHWGVALDAALAAPIFAGLAFDTSVFRYRLTTPRTMRAAARLLETGIDHASIVERVLLEQSVGKAKLRGLVVGRLALAVEGRLAWSWLSAAEGEGVDTGGLVDDLVFLEGVEVGALLMERDGGVVKLSLRSRGGLDVSLLARSLSERGGGHARAAGATVDGSLGEVAARLVAAAEGQLSRRC